MGSSSSVGLLDASVEIVLDGIGGVEFDEDTREMLSDLHVLLEESVVALGQESLRSIRADDVGEVLIDLRKRSLRRLRVKESRGWRVSKTQTKMKRGRR